MGMTNMSPIKLQISPQSHNVKSITLSSSSHTQRREKKSLTSLGATKRTSCHLYSQTLQFSDHAFCKIFPFFFLSYLILKSSSKKKLQDRSLSLSLYHCTPIVCITTVSPYSHTSLTLITTGSMLARKGIAFFSRYNPNLLRKLSFCSESYPKIPNKEDEAITDSISDFSSSLHNLSPLFSDGKFPSNGYNIELVDHDAWRVSSGLSLAWQEKELGTPEASSTGKEETNELIDFNSSNFEDEVDFEDIDNMRIRGNLFYKLDKSSKEFEEYKLEFHRRKSPKKGDDRKENSKKEKKASQSPKTSRVQEVKSTKSVINSMPQLREANVTSVENKRQRTLTFNQLTGPYHEPFCLDIFISKASVRACVVHRVTSKVVAVAHSISKDMKFDFSSTKNRNTCAAVGALLAQRSLADDIHDVIYTPRKGERLEGKLQIVLQSIIDNGINVKVKIKQRKPKKAVPSPKTY